MTSFNLSRVTTNLLAAAALCVIGASVQAGVSISDSGQASYRHDITVPPGIGGMAPKLGISFGGGSTAGPVGQSWALQGLSLITRCPAIRATDAAIKGIALVSDDKLCLDGQRLIQTDASGAALAFPQVNDAAGLTAGYREYRTEKDTFVRVRAYGIGSGIDVATGPAYFRVWTKTGELLEYGNAPGSDANTKALVLFQGKTIAMLWAVARISNNAGTSINFKYEQRDVAWGSGSVVGTPLTGHEWNISEIQYGNNKVVFNYVDRAESSPHDRAEAYLAGSKNVGIRLLNSVTTYINSANPTVLGPAANAVAAMTTKLSYWMNPRTKRSMLSGIQECAGATSGTRCLPHVRFTYSDGGSEAYVQNSPFNLSTQQMISSTFNVGAVARDFDGDGKFDILQWSDSPAANQLYLSNGDGTFRVASNFNIKTQNLFKSDGCYSSQVADINGDGLPDIIRFSGPTSAGGIAACTTFGATLVYLNNGDGSFTQVTYSGPILKRDTTATFYLQDVDQDGKADLVTSLNGTWTRPTCPPGTSCLPPSPSSFRLKCVDASGVCTRVYRGNGNGGFAEISTNAATSTLYQKPYVDDEAVGVQRFADIDGDGILDLRGRSASEDRNPYESFRSRGDGNFDLVSSASTCDAVLDFNGDGMLDCLQRGSPTSLFVGGSGVSAAGFNLTGLGYGREIIADLNSDGRDDILLWSDSPAANAAYLSNGDGTFTTSTVFGLANIQLQKADNTSRLVVGDFTGRGQVELLRLQTVAGVTSNALFVKQDSTPPGLLLTVTESSGATTTLTYVALGNPVPAAGSPSANLGLRYVSDRGTAAAAVAPKIDATPPLYIVITATSDNGISNGTIQSEYRYTGYKIDTNGRGPLGFRELRSQRPGANGDALTSVRTVLQDHPYIGSPAMIELRPGVLNNPSSLVLGATANTYCDKSATVAAEGAATASAPCPVPATAKVQRPYLRRSVATGTDLSATSLPQVTTTNSFNDTGDPTLVQAITSYSVAGISQTFTKIITNLYFPDDISGDNWILGRLQTSTVQSTVPNSLPTVATGAGSAPNASATTGTPPSLSPAILAAILQLLLED